MTERAAGLEGVVGPVQVLLIGIDEPGADEMIAAELQDLANQGAIAVIDLARVRRGSDGEVRRLPAREATGLSGALVEALLFLEPGEVAAAPDSEPGGGRPWSLTERLPRGAAAAILLIEHRWAIPLREAAAELGAEIFGDAWVHPRDLRAASLAARSRPF